MNIKRMQKGFTLIELMIVVAIVGIMASLALPAYSTYTAKARFAEVMAASGPAKTAVELAMQTSGAANFVGITNGAGGAVPDLTDPSPYVAGVATLVGVVTVTGDDEVSDKTYTLTPVKNASGAIAWTAGGSCLAASLC